MNRAIDDRSSAAYFNVRKAGQILGEYIEPGPRDAEETLSQLIAVLLARAIDRLEQGHGLRVVK